MSQPEKSAYWVWPSAVVDASVHADVVTVDVVEGPRRDEDVVERGVEGVEQVGGAAADLDPAQGRVPAALRAVGDRAEGGPGVFGGEVGARACDADEGDADPDHDDRCLRCVESRVGARVGADVVGSDPAASGCRWPRSIRG